LSDSIDSGRRTSQFEDCHCGGPNVADLLLENEQQVASRCINPLQSMSLEVGASSFEGMCYTGGLSHQQRLTTKMNDTLERNLGEQPIAVVMKALNLKPQDVVAASTVQMTHKMVARAIKGRRLTPNVKCKVRDALNLASGTSHTVADLFNY
jgi:hypothetical protein